MIRGVVAVLKLTSLGLGKREKLNASRRDAVS
jgi:hypothetical protein